MEFDKFARGKKLRAAKVPFAKLPGLIINQAKAFVINPMGFNLILDRVQLGKILGVEILRLQHRLRVRLLRQQLRRLRHQRVK